MGKSATRLEPGPAENAALAGASTRELLEELLRRGNLELSQRDFPEAERLFRAVLGYAPHDGLILQVLGELALARSDWAEAIKCAGQAVQAKLPPAAFIRVSAIACTAAFRLGGEAHASTVLARLSGKLDALLQSPAVATAENLNFAVACALSTGDEAMAMSYFRRRFAEYLFGEIEGKISPTSTMEAWCQREGVPLTILDPPREITSMGLDARHGTWEYTTVGASLVVLLNGQMVSGFDFAFTSTGELLEDSGHIPPAAGTGWFPRVHDTFMNRVFHIWPSTVTAIDEDVLFLSCSQGMHMGHWMCDFLPRLRALTGRPDLKVAIPTELPPRQRELLAYFGVDDSRIINCDLGKRYSFRSLTVLQPGSANHPEPNNVCFVTEALRVQPMPAVRTGRIFLDRAVKTRNVINRAVFDAELVRYGFRTMTLADMSFAEQRAVFSAAEVVMTTYGSDLLAVYMMNEGAHLIELNWDPKMMDSKLAPMCSMVGVRHHLMYCPPGENTERRILKKDHDFSVDIAGLRHLLSGIGIMPMDALAEN